MINFFLLAWDPENADRASAVKRLNKKIDAHKNDFERVFDIDGLVIYAQAPNANNVFHLDNSAGVILGRLFRKVQSLDDDTRVNGALKADTRRIFESRGDLLTDQYWGSYVAIMPTSDNGLLIGRDCSSLQLCYTTWLDGVFCAFSNFDALPFYENVKKDINWDYLTTFAGYAQFPLLETGLKHVEQLAAGQYAQINLHTKEIEKLRSWKPEKFTEDQIEDFDTAKQILYNTVLSVVKAQSADFDNIALMLSGGLDSSILLACLRKTHPATGIHAQHFASQENDVSEAHYAQLMANAYGVEMEVDNGEIGVRSNYLGHITPPWPIPVDRDKFKDNEETARLIKKAEKYNHSRNIKGYFSGQGGDQIFFKRPQLAPLFDYQKRNIFDTQYYGVLLNTARLTEMSVWKLLRIAREDNKNAIRTPKMRNIFLSKEFLEGFQLSDPYENHPWFQGSQKFVYGKHHQLMQFTGFNHYAQQNTPSTPDLPRIMPFISQPLIETMLRIPTHIILARGRNRGLARETFKTELTHEVYNREQKGYVTRFFFNSLIENLPSIKEFLYDGILLREGFLDREVLDTDLNEDSIKTKMIGAHIMNSVKYEKWARSLR